MTGIIDYGAGNLKSVENALDFIGEKKRVAAAAERLDEFDRIILPGVGAFGPAKQNLDRLGFSKALVDYVKSGRPLLGICLGMQMLFEKSYEFGETPGLCLIPGEVESIDALGMPVPHMGWNELRVCFDTPVLKKSESGNYVYFVHSYRVRCEDEYIAAYSVYGGKVPALVANNNVLGAQFHPERSGDFGISLLRRFCSMV
jgi:glutamine amidotransferase